MELAIEGSELVEPPHAVGMPVGTNIQVEQLFFNTPARLKYLRTVQTEQARAVEAVQRAALARPDVAFLCEVEGRTLFQTPGKGRLIDVLAALYGIAEARQLIAVEAQSPDYRVTGYVGRPTQAKSSRAHAHLSINGRPIRNLSVHQAVVAGYHGRLMIGKQPMYSLQIDMDPTLVDVNIHPHKAEVRFSEERDLCLFVQHAVRDALDGVFLANHLSAATLQAATVERRERIQPHSEGRSTTVQVKLDGLSVPAARGSASTPFAYPRGTRTTGFEQVRELYKPRAAVDEETVSALPDEGQHGHIADTPPSPANDGESKAAVQNPKAALKGLRVIGQAMATYILAENGESLYIIDQHAAHERVMYERFWQRMRDREVRQIPLLTTLTLTLGRQNITCS